MQSDQAPCNASGRVEFPASITSCLRNQRDDESPLLGGILSDSKLAWLSKGPVLEIVHVTDGAKIAAWTFGAVVKDFKTKVTCVTELPHLTSSGHPGQTDQVIVGLECELTGGMLCVFNVAGSRVLRAVNIPSKVTATNTVALGGENLGPLHPCLKSMSGIAAVGTNDGQILLIDLRRNDCDEGLRSGHLTHWEGVRDELQSCGLLSLKIVDANLLEEYPDDHLFLHLNEKYLMKHQRLVVQFPDRDGSEFFPEDPSVTSLLYIPQLASLCVGFAFGSFQIWSLGSLSLVYTLPFNEPNPVVQLSFQEACDDPNAYCYLWTVRGGISRNDPTGDLDHPVEVFGPPSATMFSLCYDEKVWLPEYGHFYKKFMMCSTGFEYDLCGGKETVGGRLISLYSMSRGMLGSGATQSPEDSSTMGPTTNAISLCLIVWETWGPTGPSSTVNPINTHMALFDINQWYVDQMPSRISQRGSSSRNKSVATYLVSYDLGSVISAGGGLLLDVRVNAATLAQFTSVQNVEEFSRPSSLAFSSEVLMERQVVHLKHPGVQRALLFDLVSTGPGALMTPTNLFHECLVLGLRPLLMDISNAMNVPVDEQRTFVLCVALEQRLGRFVCRCAREWADGRLSAAGCTLSWLLSVAWNRAAVLKQLAIRICAQLFDHSGEKLDSNAQRQLQHIVGVFHLLETLFENVVQNKWHLALSDWPQISLQNDALKLECQYYDVLQWLIDVELLPEGLNPAVPYPGQDIAAFYHSRRLELQRLFKQRGVEEDIEEFLLIDGLLKNQPGSANVFSEWERDAGGSANPGAGQYPPTSIQALLRTFLVKDVALEVKHSVVIYVLMDLAKILDNNRYKATLQNFMKFPAAFCMSVGSMRLTQAFWHLDHKAFDSALDMLLDPLVSVQDIVPWQHRCIIRLFTLQGQANMALRYVRARRPPLQEQSDIKLHLGLLIANDLIDEAFMYQRNHRTEETAKTLLSLFFQGCEERNHLRTVLQFSLDDEEEVSFSQYLDSSRHPAADDLRVLYLLKRSRYVEALDVNQDLRKKGRSGGTRDVIVNGFYKTLPSVTKKLAAHCAQQQTKFRSWTQVDKPSPLYVNPKITSPHMRYKSSLLEAAVEKSRETWAKLVDSIPPVISEVESTPFLCTPRTKLSARPRPASAAGHRTSEVKTVDRKRARENDDDILDSSNLKRSRFQKLETALAELQQQQQEKQKATQASYSTYSCTDTLSLLNTPVVQRRSPSSRARLQQQMIASSPGHSSVTPQSIIKVRHASGSSRSESPKHRVLIKDLSNEPELTEEESEQESFSSSKNVNKGESETDSEPGDNEEEEGGLVGVSARRIIDFDSDISSDLSVSQSSFESHTPSPLKSSLSNSTSEKSLSRMVVLSEARKAGKPVHTVTFGKGSVCVYDQDEPVDAEVAVQDESSNDTVDQEPSKDENLDAEKDVMETEISREGSLEDLLVNDSVSQPKFRSLRLDTSGIGSMTASDIQEDISRTDDSEVFHSADSTAQGTMYSPTFRKNLARRSVREIAQRLTGTKRALVEDEDSDGENVDFEEDEEESVHQLRKAARMEGGAQCASSLQHLTYTEGQKIEEKGPSKTACDTSTTHFFARPSIRKAAESNFSVGLPVDSLQSDVNDSKESSVLELFSAQSVSYVESEVSGKCQEDVNSGSVSVAGESIEVMEQAFEDIEQMQPVGEIVERTVVVEEPHEGPDTHSSQSHDSVEIVDLDDESDNETEDVVSNKEDRDVQEDYSITEPDEDSEDGGFINENSNIYFRTSHIDDVDSSSDGKTESSESQHETENELLSDDSDPHSVKEDSDMNQSYAVEDEEKSADGTEPQTSDKTADLQKACSADTMDVIADVPQPKLLDEVCVVVSEDMSPDVSEIQASNEDAHHAVQVVELEKSDYHHEDATHEVPSNMIHDVDHDDMPKLRLEAAISSENLCVSPEDNVNIVPSLPETNASELMDEEESTLTGENAENKEETIEAATLPKESSPAKVVECAVDISSSSVFVAEEQPPTPRSKTGRTRRSSVSSTKSETSETEASHRRITRSCQKTIGNYHDIASESFTAPGHLEALPEVQEDQEPVSIAKSNRSRRTSVSSQDARKEVAKQSRSRRSSTSSLASEVTDTKPRRKRVSVSPQSSIAEVENETLDQDKPEIMSGEGTDKTAESRNQDRYNCTESVETTSRHIKTSAQSRRRSSEVSETTVENQVKSSSGSSTVMETYETSRRLTRHQRAMLARSIEINSVDRAAMIRPKQAFHEEEAESDAVSDDDRMSHSSVRSSQRLQAKRRQQELLNDSPSSTASTIINPALTPSVQRRRRQSVSSDVSEINRDTSPVSSVRRRRSGQPPGTPTSMRSTPTRRSARISILHGNSQLSDDGDNQSVASMSPSSVASGRRSATLRPPRRLSVSSEAPSEYAFAPPQVEHSNANENQDADMAESFVFSPPKTVATPSKTKSSADNSGSASKKNARQSRASALQTIKEESSASRVSLEDTASASPVRRSSRQSWFFIKPSSEEIDEQTSKKDEETTTKRTSDVQQGYHSAYAQRKHSSIAPIPLLDSDDSNSNSSSDKQRETVKPSRTTRQSATRRQKK